MAAPSGRGRRTGKRAKTEVTSGTAAGGTAAAPSDRPAAATLTVDLGALAANYRLMKTEAPGAEVAAVVKADGYGLGAVPIACALGEAGCRTFFTAHVAEALDLVEPLSASADQSRILVLNGCLPGEEEQAAAAGLVPVLNTPGQIDAWRAQAARAGRPLPAVLHVDTGMNRLGLSPSEHAQLCAEPERLAGIDLVLVMSHLACTDTPDHPLNQVQLERFRSIAAAWPGVPSSLANSGGIFLGPDYHFDLVRPGIALYGGAYTQDMVSPAITLHGRVPSDSPGVALDCVVSLHAPILQVRRLRKGDTVGYGAMHQAEFDCTIATVGVGYADGYCWALSNKALAFIGSRSIVGVGRISMDLTTFDLTAVPAEQCRPGTIVELLGPRFGIDDLARRAGTIGYEILTSLGKRFARRYVTSTNEQNRPG